MSDENESRRNGSTNDERDEHLADDPTDSVAQVRRALQRQRIGSRWNPWTLGIVATLLVAFGILGIMSQQRPVPSPELPGDRMNDGAEADPLPDLATLHAAVVDVEKALATEHPDDVDEAARHLRGVWQRFRPRMQAQGGVEPWDSFDTDAFEDGVNRLIGLVEAKDLSAARRQVDELFEIIQKYD